MGDNEKQIDKETTKKYLALMTLIHEKEKFMRSCEIFYFFLNFVIFFSTALYVSEIISRTIQTIPFFDMFYISLCHVFGISINTYWTASSMRTQLKLKLRYFQARLLERKLNCSGEFFYSDESLFFNSKIGKIESPDGKEEVIFPIKGIARMDGFMASTKPRILSLFFPMLFFIIYITSFISVLLILF